MNVTELIFFAFWPGAGTVAVVVGPVCVVDGAIYCGGVVDQEIVCPGVIDQEMVCPGVVDKAIECEC